MFLLQAMLLISLGVGKSRSHLSCNLHHPSNDVRCICAGVDHVNQMDQIFRWSNLADLKHQEDAPFKKVVFTRCTHLQLDLQPPHPSPMPHLVIKNIQQVVVALSQDMPHPSMSFKNVSIVRYTPHERTRQKKSTNLLMYVSLGVIVVLVLILSLFLFMLLWSRVINKEMGDTKKVSRAESWRYEASMYINPPNRQQPVFIPPPPFPDFLQNSSSLRTPDSSNSTPLMRPKNSHMREVDLVRASLPVNSLQQQGANTPPAYREPRDSLAGRVHEYRCPTGVERSSDVPSSSFLKRNDA